MSTIRAYLNTFPRQGKRVYIDPSAVIIGDVLLGDDVSVWPKVVIRGDVNAISIGDATNIQDGAILHVTHDGPFTPGGKPLIIGKGVTIGHQCVLHGCSISDYCLIGIGSILLDGVEVEDHVLIGAGSLIPLGKQLKKGHLYLGNPARAIRALTDKELEQLSYSATHYVKLKNNYLKR